MNILYCKVMPIDDSILQEMKNLGYTVDVLDHEFDDIEEYTKYDIVIGFRIFKYHEVSEFTNLKYLILYSAGTDHLDMDYFMKHEIKVINAKDVYSSSIAEFTIGRLCSVLKNERYFETCQKEHRWKQNMMLDGLEKKKILIIGNGHVTQALVSKLVAFDTKITISSRTEESDVLSLDALVDEIPKADIIIVTIALSNLTYHLLNEKQLRLMKDDAILVNMARGAIINHQALLKVIKEKPLRLILDVFEEEPLAEQDPLWDYPNAWLSPHNSFISKVGFKKLKDHFVQTLKEIKEP